MVTGWLFAKKMPLVITAHAEDLSRRITPLDEPVCARDCGQPTRMLTFALTFQALRC